MDAIRAINLTRHFGDIIAVNNISFAVKQGEIFGFLGPNGSGKTVTIKMLTGILPITTGSAWVDQVDVNQDPHEVRRRIGYMSQKFSLYDDLTVQENLRFYGKAYGLSAIKLETQIQAMVERNNLGRYLNRRAGQLSGGWKQRLALSCAMLHEPRILYLDEPTAGIDPVARRQLWDLLFEYSGQGITFFVTTHYMDEAERCSHLAYIYYGQLIADGTPEELCKRPDITPAGTQRYEITVRNVTSALNLIRQMPEVISATIFGRSIHALLSDSISSAELISKLSRHNLHAEEVRQLMPSLEDVFVELTMRKQRELELR